MSDINPIEKIKEPLTLRNVGSLTTFEIRQELNRRNAMDLDEEKVQINFKTLLQRLVQELVKEEENNTLEHTTVVIDQAQLKRETDKAMREEKKKEALERSKQRQADKDYFIKKQELNVKKNDEVVEITKEEGFLYLFNISI